MYLLFDTTPVNESLRRHACATRETKGKESFGKESLAHELKTATKLSEAGWCFICLKLVRVTPNRVTLHFAVLVV